METTNENGDGKAEPEVGSTENAEDAEVEYEVSVSLLRNIHY